MEFPKSAPLAIAALRNMQSDKAVSLDNSAIGITNAAALATAMIGVGELARYIARADTREPIRMDEILITLSEVLDASSRALASRQIGCIALGMLSMDAERILESAEAAKAQLDREQSK